MCIRDRNNAVFSPEVTSNYGLRLTTVNGCFIALDFTIVVLKNNQVFAPNALIAGGNATTGVANSNVFYIDGPDVEEIEFLRIFDRWGNMVYTLDNVPPGVSNHSWNGSRGNRLEDGALLDSGVYVYVAQVRFRDQSTQIVQGDITLLK